MQILKKTAGFLFSIPAGLLVILSLVIVTPIYLLIFLFNGKNADKDAVALSRVWASFVLFSCGVQLKVHNKKKLDPNQTYIFISNHRSYLDIPVCARTTNHTFKYLAKDELTRVPLLGYIITHLYITVKRQSMRDRVAALKKMEDAINSGISVWLYPEGTRNTSDDPLTDFQDGAFTLAVNTGKPLAVLTVMDTRKLLEPGKFFQVFPGKVEAWWSDPIETKNMTRKDVPKLKEQARNLMLSYIADKK
jgi:1-acyl-sn-glycerol-3-phosphate acyltransferase